jgi:hypothetical protein
MADSLHMALSNFRETMLTAIARLEFQMRDSKSFAYMSSSPTPSPSLTSDSPDMSKVETTLGDILNRLEKLELKNTQIPILSSIPTSTNSCDLLKMESPSFTKNLLIPSVKSTPALTAAVAAATSSHLTDFTLDSSATNTITSDKDEIMISDDEEEEVVVEEEEEEEVVVEEEEEVVVEEEEEVVVEEEEAVSEGEVVEEDTESSPELKKLVLNNKEYYMGCNNSVYQETDEGYEQIGMYDAKENKVTLFGEESDQESELEEDEEEEDAVEVEDFVFKGKTYQIDSDKNIYLEGEHIGVWNGKKIVALDA